MSIYPNYSEREPYKLKDKKKRSQKKRVVDLTPLKVNFCLSKTKNQNGDTHVQQT